MTLQIVPNVSSYQLGKRLTKSSKLYFYDTGLVSYLLGVEKAKQLDTHSMRGAIFENLIITEFIKKALFVGRVPELYYVRDNKDLEVDLIEKRNSEMYAYEIKSSYTMNENFCNNLYEYAKLVNLPINNTAVIYGGDKNYKSTDKSVGFMSWRDL